MLHIADVSEYQSVDWAAYGRAYPAVIVRLHSGYRADLKASANLAGARANVRLRGWYQYVVKGRDAIEQAKEFTAMLVQAGGLHPGEWVIGDFEEGTGDQSPRAQAWLAVMDRLGVQAWDYSYEGFFRSNLAALLHDGRPDWVANYRSRPPGVPWTLWQHTDHEAHTGIAAPCDCSIFNGTADDLARLISGNKPLGSPTVSPPAPVTPTIPVLEATGMQVNTEFYPWPGKLDGNGRGFVDVPHDFAAVVSVMGQGSDPDTNGYWPPITPNPQPHGAGVTRVDIAGAPGQTGGVYVKVIA